MNRFLQKATSASMSVALLFTLTGGAVADLSGDLNSDAVSVFETDALGEAVPADETLITVTAGSETAEEQRGDTPDLTENGYPDEEETLKNEEENEEEETETTSDDCAPEVTAHASAASVDGALDAEEATNSENETEEDIEPFLLIGDTEIDFTEDASGNGWSYECDDEGGFVVLEGFNGSDQLIGTAGSDLTIKTTGVNRIGTLIVDGDLNLIGSGILLIDNIELAEGKDLNLLTNTTIYEDGTGSVAVFVKRVEITVNEDTDNSRRALDYARCDDTCEEAEDVAVLESQYEPLQLILHSRHSCAHIHQSGEQHTKAYTDSPCDFVL